MSGEKVQGWRQLDPQTGDEAGTTEGDFQVEWKGDYFFGKNLAINTENNTYLDGIGAKDWTRLSESSRSETGPECIYLWMSDYHPDGGQLFMPKGSDIPFFVCLGKRTIGDNVRPQDMQGFLIPPGKGIYIHPVSEVEFFVFFVTS